MVGPDPLGRNPRTVILPVTGSLPLFSASLSNFPHLPALLCEESFFSPLQLFSVQLYLQLPTPSTLQAFSQNCLSACDFFTSQYLPLENVSLFVHFRFPLYNFLFLITINLENLVLLKRR